MTTLLSKAGAIAKNCPCPAEGVNYQRAFGELSGSAIYASCPHFAISNDDYGNFFYYDDYGSFSCCDGYDSFFYCDSYESF